MNRTFIAQSSSEKVPDSIQSNGVILTPGTDMYDICGSELINNILEGTTLEDFTDLRFIATSGGDFIIRMNAKDLFGRSRAIACWGNLADDLNAVIAEMFAFSGKCGLILDGRYAGAVLGRLMRLKIAMGK